MLRPIVLTIVAAIVAPGLARADSGMLPGGASIKFNRLFLHESSCNNGGYCSYVPDPNNACYGSSGTCGGNQGQQQPLQNPQSLWHYFNLAHCVCGQSGASPLPQYFENTFAYELLLQNQTTPVHRPAEIWVGAMCDDTVMRPMNCHRIDSAGIADIASIQTTNGVAPEVPVYDLMEPEPTAMGCDQRVLTAAEWVIVDSNGNGTYDYFVSQAINTDSLPPPLPASFTAEGAENAIQISWTPPTGDVADVAYYQALCARPDGTPALTSHKPPQYMTARMLCNAGLDISLSPTIIAAAGRVAPATADAAVDASTGTPVDAPAEVNLPQGLAQLDPAYICGEADDATATSMRIEGLENGIAYTVVFLAIDKFGNPAGTYFTSSLTPKPVTDFWQDLHDRGSGVQGGFCLIADTFGNDSWITRGLRGFRDDDLGGGGGAAARAYYSVLAPLGAIVRGHVVRRVIAAVVLAPVVALALVWHALGLPLLLGLAALLIVARRRRWLVVRRLAPALAALAILVAPGRARAQAPYWEDQRNPATPETAPAPSNPVEADDVRWHVGIGVGPYIPQIDAQLGGAKPGPYQEMFGSSPSWTPMFNFDRVLLHPFGLLMAGISVGYLGKSAHAWQICMDPNDYTCSPQNPMRARSTGDSNSFHLLPLVAAASYRFSYLDDAYGIPIVPYARGGLAYYLWWADGPNGKTSVAQTSSGMSTSAKGASMGLVGALGIAVRAERIDADAARSMRDTGLEHAGFFFEYDLGWVNGFGSSTKLSVGDHTWFAGVDFEF